MAKEKLTVTLDENAQDMMARIKTQGEFTSNSVILNEALHRLYRELTGERQLPDLHQYINQGSLNPDDFE